MHLASIDIEGITFEISKEKEKHSLFRNMHTIATSAQCNAKHTEIMWKAQDAKSYVCVNI